MPAAPTDVERYEQLRARALAGRRGRLAARAGGARAPRRHRLGAHVPTAVSVGADTAFPSGRPAVDLQRPATSSSGAREHGAGVCGRR